MKVVYLIQQLILVEFYFFEDEHIHEKFTWTCGHDTMLISILICFV